MTTTPLAGKVALVTGGAKRVGKAVAIALAQKGGDVAITYLTSKAEARETKAAIESMGRRALMIRADLADVDAIDHVRDELAATFDRLDILINNASAFEPTDGDMSAKQFDQMMAVNARGPVMLTQALAPLLADGAIVDDATTLGRVVNFIDIHVMGEPLKGYLAYNMSKAALQEATRTLALELAPHVTVNAIAPGVVAWADAYTDQMKSDYMQRVPLARPGTPDDAAAAVMYLVRDAHYCTGQTIRLDGGRLWT